MKDEQKPKGPLRSRDSSGKGPLIMQNIEVKHSTREPLGINSEPKRGKGKTLYGYAGSYIVEERTRIMDEGGTWYDA